MIRTLLRISFHKITAFFGGFPAFVIVCVLLCCCFGATSVISGAKPPESVQVAIVDLCDRPLSQSLCSAVSGTEGIEAKTVKTLSEGEDLMLFGSAEAMMVIDSEYDRKVKEDGVQSLISIKSAPGADSAQLLRETAAGLLIAQRSEQRVREMLENDGLLPDGEEDFVKFINEAPTPRMYSVETYGEKNSASVNSSGLLHASYNGVACLSLLLVLLTLTRRMADAYSRNVAERIETLHYGKTVSLTGDFLALLIVALLISGIAFVFSPIKQLQAIPAWICYSVCISGISLLISRFNTTGRIDILAPFLAIVTSIVGGCFTDLSVLSETLRIVARCVPQGQMLAAAKGLPVFCLVLTLEGAVAIACAVLRNRRSSNS